MTGVPTDGYCWDRKPTSHLKDYKYLLDYRTASVSLLCLHRLSESVGRRCRLLFSRLHSRRFQTPYHLTSHLHLPSIHLTIATTTSHYNSYCNHRIITQFVYSKVKNSTSSKRATLTEITDLATSSDPESSPQVGQPHLTFLTRIPLHLPHFFSTLITHPAVLSPRKSHSVSFSCQNHSFTLNRMLHSTKYPLRTQHFNWQDIIRCIVPASHCTQDAHLPRQRRRGPST